MFIQRRKIEIERKASPADAVTNDSDNDLQDFAKAPNVNVDNAYSTLVDYLLRNNLEKHFSKFNRSLEEAKLIKECSVQKVYVKHIKHPKLGLVLTFPVTVLNSVFSHLQG